ncbi:cysteine hydrolase family protein [Colletotrichum truncatum]|uniref:Cysteine hydrolase family protein n=1 Tax=Colletotrichum truncatum TaxID=5467 RepID=A0ACC3ZD86_COLTU|nr:cysteine hydrolase family protein [Colletotrichum truncatum]KAF6798045.1 cysteine hydrolase family protein [Colletotrichum truncatum]
MACINPTNRGGAAFGRCYAILNLDLMSILIDNVKGTPEGESFISNCVKWNEAVHQRDPRPLTIFTTLYFANAAQPELNPYSPFAKILKGVDTFEKGSAAVQIDERFRLDEKDIVLQKTRWYAGSGNSLEQILRAQNIDTVIISGVTLSGVVMSTIYRLFDLDYNIYVISDNVVDFAGIGMAELSDSLKGTLMGNMRVKVINIEEALQMLERS